MKTVDLPPITQADAEQERDRLFTEPVPPPPYPAIELETVISYEGYTFRVVFRDTSIADAVSVLKKRGCIPVGAAPASPATNGRAPHFADDGTPTCLNGNCSRHGKPMEPSQHGGWYCKGKDARTGNAKGYCEQIA